MEHHLLRIGIKLRQIHSLTACTQLHSAPRKNDVKNRFSCSTIAGGREGGRGRESRRARCSGCRVTTCYAWLVNQFCYSASRMLWKWLWVCDTIDIIGFCVYFGTRNKSSQNPIGTVLSNGLQFTSVWINVNCHFSPELLLTRRLPNSLTVAWERGVVAGLVVVVPGRREGALVQETPSLSSSLSCFSIWAMRNGSFLGKATI